jgi:hypothetical protein
MTWNEIFTRTGMFLTTLSASFVALALIADSTTSRTSFRVAALAILPIVLLLGIATYLRLNEARLEDSWLVVGMNRLRHGYLDLAPELEQYFVTSQYDDSASILHSYHPSDAPHGPSPTIAGTSAIVGMIASTPTIVGVIDGLLAGALAALVMSLLIDSAVVFVPVGVVVATVAATLLTVALPHRLLERSHQSYRPRFPSPAHQS